MVRKVLLFVIAFTAVASAQVFSNNGGGWCQKGGQGVVTQGLKSSGTYTLPNGSLISGTGVQASYPLCRVTVYNTGTLVKPTIYSTPSLGALGNPFTANADGSFLFFAASGCFDIVTDQGSMPAAHTDTDVCLGGAGIPGGGTVTQANPATGAGTLSPLFTFGFATQTTTPALSFSLTNAGAHRVFGNPAGSSGAPSYFNLTTAELPFTYTGNTTLLPTVSASFSGTGAAVCRDASGNLTTAGCAGAGVTSFNARTGAVTPQTGDYGVAQVTGAAPLASPALTGVPVAPTAAPGTNTTQIATTAFVIANATVQSVFGRTGVVTAQTGDYAVAQVTGAAPLASPSFTGVPLAPTAAVDTNTTQIATTAFVLNQATTSVPATIFGAGNAGAGSRWARSDHVHPGGYLLSSTGIPAPSPVATACPTGEAVFKYGLDSGGNYRELNSFNNASGASTLLGRQNFCWPFSYNDTGTAVTEIKEAFRINHLTGSTTTPSGTRDERSVAIQMSNSGAETFHQAIGGVYAEWTITGTPTFAGHPGGEASASIFRGNLSFGGGAWTGGAKFYTYTAQMEHNDASTPAGGMGTYLSYISSLAGSGNQAASLWEGFGCQSSNDGGTETNVIYTCLHALAPASRFANNYGVFIANYGANAADYNFRSDGVNSAGTAAGFNALQGPTVFGAIAHATAGYQIDTLGAMKLKAGAGVRQLDMFGSTSGSCGLSTDATSTAFTSTCPISGTSLALSGLLTSYNSITTAGLSFPVQVGASTLSGQTTALGPTAVFTVGGATTSYLAVGSVYCKTAVATATVALTVDYTDASNTVQSIAPSAAACTALGASSFAVINSPIRVKNGTAITYSTAVANSPNYDVSVQLYEISTN